MLISIVETRGCRIWASTNNAKATPPMPGRRCVKENDLAALQATKRSAAVAPEVKVLHVCFYQVWIRLPTLALKPGGDITRSPKEGYQGPHKKDLCPTNFCSVDHLRQTGSSPAALLCFQWSSLRSWRTWSTSRTTPACRRPARPRRAPARTPGTPPPRRRTARPLASPSSTNLNYLWVRSHWQNVNVYF